MIVICIRIRREREREKLFTLEEEGEKTQCSTHLCFLPQAKKVFSLWLLDAGYSLCIARIDGNHARGPDGAFQKKRSLGKMGLLKRMGLHILTLDSCSLQHTQPLSSCTCTLMYDRVYRCTYYQPRLKRGWFVDHPNRNGERGSPYLTFHRGSRRWL